MTLKMSYLVVLSTLGSDFAIFLRHRIASPCGLGEVYH